MQICKKCGAELSDNAQFCPHCGTTVGLTAAAEPTASDPRFAPTVAASPTGYGTSSDPSVEWPAVQKAKKEKTTLLTLAIVLAAVAILSVCIGGSMRAKSPLTETIPYSGASKVGDYVSTELVYTTILYSKSSTSSGKTTDNTYWCYAINTNGDTLLLEVGANYYNDHLAALENNEAYLFEGGDQVTAPVSVVGDVALLNAAFAEQSKDDEIVSLILNRIPNRCQLKVLASARHEYSMDLAVFIMAFAVIGALICLIRLSSKSGEYKKVKNAYADYGNVEQIHAKVTAEPWFTDGTIAVDRDFIVSVADHNTIVSTAEALGMYQYVHRTNFVTDQVALIVVNRYGEKIVFSYPRKAKDDGIRNAILQTKPFCPNAAVGYSQSSNDYINQHKIKRT